VGKPSQLLHVNPEKLGIKLDNDVRGKKLDMLCIYAHPMHPTTSPYFNMEDTLAVSPERNAEKLMDCLCQWPTSPYIYHAFSALLF